MNSVSLIGRLTKDPELKVGSTGKKFTRFTLAVNNGRTKEGEDQTAFIPVVVFNRQAEVICNYKKKGEQIALNGSISTGSYKDKDGRTVYTTEVIASNIEFVGGRGESAEASERPSKPDSQMAFMESNEDVPF